MSARPSIAPVSIHPLDFILLSALCLLEPLTPEAAAELCGTEESRDALSALRRLATRGWAEKDEDGIYSATEEGRLCHQHRGQRIAIYQPLTVDKMAELFERHRTAVGYYAQQLASQPADAEELVSMTLTQALRYADRFVPGTKAQAWLTMIMRNQFINRYRRGQKTPSSGMVALPIEKLESAAYKQISSNGTQYARNIGYDALVAADVKACIARLSPAQAEVMELVLSGKTYEAAAAEMGIPVGTYRSRVFHTRKVLARLLTAAGITSPILTNYQNKPQRRAKAQKL